MEIYQQSRLTLNSANLPKYASGFLLAVKVNGANLVNNQFLKSQLNAQFVMTKSEPVIDDIDTKESMFASLYRKLFVKQ